MTDRHLPLRAWAAGFVLVLATIAFAAPAQASQCPWIPEWCTCGYCLKSPDCNCRLREGNPDGISCEVFYANGGCLSLQSGGDTPVPPETAEEDLTLEQLLALAEPHPATDLKAGD